MPFASLSLTSVLAYMGSLLVPLGSSMRAGIGNAAVNAAEFTSSSLSLKEGNGFGRLVWLAYNPAKHVFDWIAPNLGVVWCGQARTKQVELTGKCQCMEPARRLMLMVCVSMIQSVLYIVIVQGRRVRWFTARGWLRRVRLNAVSSSVTS